MAGQKHHDPNKKEGFLEFAGAMAIIAIVLIAFVWFLASNKIVYYTAPALRWSAVPWAFLDAVQWQKINEAFVFYRQRPGEVTLINFMAFANDALRPISWIVCGILVLIVAKRLIPMSSSSAGALKRELSPIQLAKEISKVFPAIVPVLHLGPDLVAEKLPLWRKQTFPVDVWQKERVDGKPLSDGRRLFLDRVEAYFRGGEFKDGPKQMRNGRRWSRMLGYLVVDLLPDSARHEGICFPDRFSPQGKVLYALLAAHAFGGREGKADFRKAADELNWSCAGAKNGLPNLTVAQWLYTKYRNNKEAKVLFQVHHWEHTFLYTLFIKAKLTGKVTHTQFLWLKPLDRIMFYALNTVGRATPHTESASVFAQIDYETKCAKSNRLPIVLRNGAYEAAIVMNTAIEGFQEAFDQYVNGTGDDDDWLGELRTWAAARAIDKKADEVVVEQMKAMQVDQARQSAVLTQVGEPEQTAYDTAVERERAAKNESATSAWLSSLNGGDAGSSAED